MLMQHNQLEMLLEKEGIPQKACFLLQEHAVIEDVITGNTIYWKTNDRSRYFPAKNCPAR